MNVVSPVDKEPRYPVIDPHPSFSKTVRNFNSDDAHRLKMLTGFSTAVGCLAGIKPGMKVNFAMAGLAIGLPLGFWIEYQNSLSRLKGFFPNDEEVARYKKQVAIPATGKPPYPVIDPNPGFAKVVRNFNLDDCFNISFPVGFYLTIAHLLSKNLPIPFKGAAMVTAGFPWVMKGFMNAYQHSEGRLKGFFPDGRCSYPEWQAQDKEPRYPVIDPDPSFSKIVRNFNSDDAHRLQMLAGFSTAVGCLAGIKPGFKVGFAMAGLVIGLPLGFGIGYQNSSSRLKGFFPNDGEVARYKKQVAIPPYPVFDPNPGFAKVVRNVNLDDYFSISFFSGSFLTIAHLLSKNVPTPFKGAGMVTVGFPWVMGEFMSAYQHSEGRLKGFFPNGSKLAELMLDFTN